MEDVTIIIQGRLDAESYNFYTSKYRNYPVIISTWTDNTIDLSTLPQNFKAILAPLPKESGDQNINYQITSTLNALECVKTKYAIKVRGDEYWSYPENIYASIKEEPNKLHTSSVFFRAWQYCEYHMSDHLIGGTTQNMITLFTETKKNVELGRLNMSKMKVDGKFEKWVHTHAPEERLTKSYLEAKEGSSFESYDGRELMKKHFQIIDINKLKPYKIKANIFKIEFKDNFIPEQNFSISTIEQLFSNEPYIIPQ